jgi:23S rRNA (uracil1939-C5)-methyltransferase
LNQLARKQKQFNYVQIIDIADKGKSIGRCSDGQIVLVEKAVPGDELDAISIRKRKGMLHCVPLRYHKHSPDRVDPFCAHFGTCGGCKWQHLNYTAQLKYKEKGVRDALQRLAGIENPHMLPILEAEQTRYYRNKLEFTFSNKRWLTQEEIDSGASFDHRDGVGFHYPGAFDKVVDIQTCFLQPDPSNDIRNAVREFAFKNQLEFQDIRERKGLLRNLILRTNQAGEVMLILVFLHDDADSRGRLVDYLLSRFPEIISCYYCINGKANDSIADQEVIHIFGKLFLDENLENVRFQIGPKSFFQTNTSQAIKLYQTARNFADLKGDDVLYDLYSGLGSIALFLAKNCGNVVGIEEVEPAVEDARRNAVLNQISNAQFVVGDVRQVLHPDFPIKYGSPDVLITDPPRAGMHPDVIQSILRLMPPKIVYVSCNPSTQARDIKLLMDQYLFVQSRAVDMFPHTSHIENVALLEKKN